MKSIITFILVILAIAAIFFGIGYMVKQDVFGSINCLFDDHKFDEGVVTDPTCSVDGYITYTCTRKYCNKKYSYRENGDPALGHDEKIAELITPATCTEPEYSMYRCTREGCEWSEIKASKAALGHSYDSGDVIAPTCTEDGYVIRHCTRCDNTKREKGESALGHLYDQVDITEATCTEAGYIVSTCTRNACGHIKEEDGDPAKGHKINSVVTNATCTVDGYILHICEVCEYTEKEEANETNGLIHKGHGEYIKIIVANDQLNLCENGGQELTVCKICLESTDLNCKNCEDMFIEIEDILPRTHSATSEWVVKKAPTLTSQGLIEGPCDFCGLQNAKITLPALTSSRYTKSSVLSTCMEEGTDTYKIKIGTWTGSFDVSTPKSHRLNTYAIDASKTYGCEEVLRMFGINTGTLDLRTFKLSDVEGLRITESVPTCINAEYAVVDCDYCDAPLIFKMYGLHDYDPAKGEVHDPKCIDRGYTEYTCENDPNHPTYKCDYVSENGHSYVVNIEKSVFRDTSATLYLDCTECDAYKRISPITGTYKLDKIAATCLEEGAKYATYDYKDPETNETVNVVDQYVGAIEIVYGIHFNIKNGEYVAIDTDVTRKQYYLRELEEIFSENPDDMEIAVRMATCQQTGYVVFNCKVCGYVEIVWDVKGEHIYDSGTPMDATCTTPKRILYRCTIGGCDAYMYQGTLAGTEIGHSYVYTETPATAYNEGNLKITCSRDDCGFEKNIEIPNVSEVNGWVEVSRSNQTCERDGYVDYKYEISNYVQLGGAIYYVASVHIVLPADPHVNADPIGEIYEWELLGIYYKGYVCKHCDKVVVIESYKK